MLTIRRAFNGTASSCQHDTLFQGELVDDVFLAVAKTLLSLDIEDPGHLGAAALFDFGIRVVEGPIQRFRKQAANGAFTHRHETNEEDVLSLHTNKNGALSRTRGAASVMEAHALSDAHALSYRSVKASAMMRGVMKISSSVLSSRSMVRLNSVPT